MKRTTYEMIEWHRLRAKNQARRNGRIRTAQQTASEQVPARADRIERPSASSIPPSTSLARGPRRTIAEFIEPPGDFSLRRNYDEVASFFSHLRSMAYNDRTFARPFGIEFATLKSVSPGAGLMLAAELYRLQQFMGRRLSAIRQEEWDADVRRTLQELGLFKLLATPNVYPHFGPAQTAGVDILEYSVDTEVDGYKCGYLLDCLAEIAGELPAQNFIYDGLIEALKNSKHHAYSDERWYGVEPGTWFMTGSYDRIAQQLTAAVFDLGVGIPATLPRSGIWEHLRPYLSLGSSDDAKMIAAAMAYGRTRTQLQGRGKGLPIMMRLLDHHPGYLRIVSGRGEAIYDSLTKDIQEITHAESIGGTLIEWSISRDRRI